MKTQIDSLIHARWIIPIEPFDTIWENHSLAIDQGRILALLPTTEAHAQYESKSNITLNNHAILPGLINAHAHSPMTLFRGMADDLPLMTWLNEHIWPAESRWLDEEFIRDGSQLAFLEMIRSGTTCFNENYFYSDISAEVTVAAGLRALVGSLIINVPTRQAKTVEEYLTKMDDFCQKWRHHPLITPAVHPQGPYTVHDAALLQAKAYADQHNLLMHIHMHETDAEIRQSLQEFNKRPLKRFYDLGLVSERLQCVHMTQINDEDMEILHQTHPQVVTCPESNLKLVSGFCPVKKLLDAGINVAIGTDGAASNNDLDMFGEMRSASLLGKIVAQNPTAVNAQETLRMATLNGAKALGLGSITGSLVPGKAADIIAIDLSHPNTQPIYNPVSQIVYAANSQQVTDVWVAGKQLYKNGEFLTLDPAAIIAKADVWKNRIANK
ncbi:MAG TPA: TRZ/ATZ family hydrolase [Gammaproteobacteria bacterium]|nr:TRZ/ATZ family hydrolase [Gammaproteobacteria bacterium]